MSGYWVKRPDLAATAKCEDFQFLSDEFPALAWVLSGRPKDHEAGYMSPSTLQLFFDAGRLKFCISPKEGNQIAFGTVDDATKPLEAIEMAIREERFEWKKRKER